MHGHGQTSVQQTPWTPIYLAATGGRAWPTQAPASQPGDPRRTCGLLLYWLFDWMDAHKDDRIYIQSHWTMIHEFMIVFISIHHQIDNRMKPLSGLNSTLLTTKFFLTD